MKKLLTGAFIFFAVSGFAQQKSESEEKQTTMGLELYALPYITGGYYGSLWIGHGHMRYRAIITEITTPGFFLEEGFTNNKIQAYTAIADYFFKQNFEKW